MNIFNQGKPVSKSPRVFTREKVNPPARVTQIGKLAYPGKEEGNV